MQNINTDELFPLRNSNYKLATLLLVVLIAYALYTNFYHCIIVIAKMASIPIFVNAIAFATTCDIEIIVYE